MSDLNRIQQGADGKERLFTVRPRNSSTVTEKRGNVSSIRFMLPDKADRKKWLDRYVSETGGDSPVRAFEQAITEGEGTEPGGYINFLAQSVAYDIQEKSQTMHTFGGQEAVYFFGRAPINVTFTGLLIDDLDNDQFCKFLNLYYNFLRGSKASQDFCYVELSLNNATFIGAFTGISVQQSSDRDTDVIFSAQFQAKTFTLASTDSIFADSPASEPVVMVREADPTITQEAITAAVNANIDAALSAVKANAEADANIGAALSVGDYTKSFGTLPTVSALLGFDASDITDYFSDINNFINNVTKPVQDLANQVDNFASDAISLLEGIENGVDDVINNVESASNSVFGAINTIEDSITTITNFPQSLATKLGSIGSSVGVGIAGSENITSSDAMASLGSKVPVGAARGTPEGSDALNAVNTISTTQTPGSSADTVPGLSPA